MTDHAAFDGQLVVRDEQVPADSTAVDLETATRLEAAMEVTG